MHVSISLASSWFPDQSLIRLALIFIYKFIYLYVYYIIPQGTCFAENIAVNNNYHCNYPVITIYIAIIKQLYHLLSSLYTTHRSIPSSRCNSNCQQNVTIIYTLPDTEEPTMRGNHNRTQ